MLHGVKDMKLSASSDGALRQPLNVGGNGKWYNQLLWLAGYAVLELFLNQFLRVAFGQHFLQLGAGYLFAVLLLLPATKKITFGVAAFLIGLYLRIHFSSASIGTEVVNQVLFFGQVLLGVWAIHKIPQFNINRPKHAIEFMTYGFLLPAIVVGVAHAVAVGATTHQDFVNSLAFALAPGISILVVVPLFFATVASKISDSVSYGWLKVLWFSTVVSLSIVIFWVFNDSGAELAKFSVLLLPVIMYSSYQYSFRFNTLMMLCITLVAVWVDGWSGHASVYETQLSFVMIAVYIDIAESILLVISALRSRNEWSAKAIARKNDALELADGVFRNISNAIVVSDKNLLIVSVNEAFTKISGYEPDEIIGQPTSILNSGVQDAAFYKAFWAEIERTGTWHGEFCHRRKDGSLYYELKTISMVQDTINDEPLHVSIGIDITQDKQLRDEFEYLTTHDVVTGLINRITFEKMASKALQDVGIGRDSMAVILLDMDNFKYINDAFGHHFGDKVLKQIAERLQACLSEDDLVGRFGGDEFSILVPHCNKASAIELAEHILVAFREPAKIDDLVTDVGMSIGIALSSSVVKDLDTLIANASHEVRKSKQQGKSIYNFYREMPASKSSRVIWIQNELRKAMTQGDLSLFYQPQKSLVTQKSVGWEALIRWNHPEAGPISPGEFIPIAENSGYIRAIDDWVIKTTCEQICIWIEHDLPLRRVAINVSYSTFVRPQFFDELTSLVARYRIEPRWIELEITERMLIHTDNEVLETMNALVALGFHISIDDFGTGYSNLAYISKFPIHKIKIDMSFVRGIDTNVKNQNIVKAIIDLSHGLKLTAIAEGVETAAENDYLESLGCDEVQGFWYHRPINANDSKRLLTDEFRNLKI